MRAGREPWFPALRERAGKEPLGVDISDFSDEFCVGYLAGQQNVLDYLALLGDDGGAEPPGEPDRWFPNRVKWLAVPFGMAAVGAWFGALWLWPVWAGAVTLGVLFAAMVYLALFVWPFEKKGDY